MEDEDAEDALAALPREEKAQSSWWRRRPPAAAGIGGDGEDGGDPGEAEEGLERGPDSRLHSSAATQRGAAETGAQARGRGLRKRRRGAAEAGTCVRRGLGGLGLCFGLGVAAGLGKANLEDARNSLDSLVRFLPVAGRF